MFIIIMAITNGSVVKYKSSELNNNFVNMYAEKVDETNLTYIFFNLIRNDKKTNLRYDTEITELPKQHVHFLEIIKNDGNYTKAWNKLGVEHINSKSEPKNQRFRIYDSEDMKNVLQLNYCDDVDKNDNISDTDTWSSDTGSIVSVDSFYINDDEIEYENGDIHINCKCKTCVKVSCSDSNILDVIEKYKAISIR